MNEFKTTTTTFVPVATVRDMVESAFEGGITYWCSAAQPVDPAPEIYQTPGKRWYSCLGLYETEFKICITQHEEHTTGAGCDVFLTPANVQTGIDLMASKYPERLQEMVEENWDAETADVFIQCCVFGDIIYG